jgi:hypothetical protein
VITPRYFRLARRQRSTSPQTDQICGSHNRAAFNPGFLAVAYALRSIERMLMERAKTGQTAERYEA